jgi:hypothetical protein
MVRVRVLLLAWRGITRHAPSKSLIGCFTAQVHDMNANHHGSQDVCPNWPPFFASETTHASFPLFTTVYPSVCEPIRRGASGEWPVGWYVEAHREGLQKTSKLQQQLEKPTGQGQQGPEQPGRQIPSGPLGQPGRGTSAKTSFATTTIDARR